MLAIGILTVLWPHGNSAIPGLVEAIAAAAPDVFPRYGLTSDLSIAHAMAQFSHECGAGTKVVENLDYSAQGLTKTWPSRFDPAKAQAFAHNPQMIANEVYNGRMGNQPGTNDGYRFRGRGGAQTTGRNAYEKLGDTIGLDLTANPDLVNDPAHFLECAVSDLVLCGCLPFALQDDINGVTYHLNGGYIGLAERSAWLAQWKTALQVNGPADHGTLWIQQTLNKLGTEPTLTADGVYGPVTAAAVRMFQQTMGLTTDGKIEPVTIAALEQALARIPQ